MQTLLQRFGKGRYLAKDGTWTDDPSRARAFATGFSARTYRAFHKLSDTQVIPAVHEARRGFVPSGRLRCVSRETDRVRAQVEAHIELGPNHRIHIRGTGAGLSWGKGTELARVDSRTWVWSADCLQEEITFGLLLDDEIWAKGEPLVLAPGNRLEISPDFDWPEIPRTG